MDNKKKVVALSDDVLDSVAGGLITDSTRMINEETGEVYNILVDRPTLYGVLLPMGAFATDSERIARLLELGYIVKA